MQTKLLILIMNVSLLLGSCSVYENRSTGTLAGHVTIGPLIPVQTAGELEPTPAPEVYAARQILIYKPDGHTVFAHVELDSHGNYQVELPIGTYWVDINHAGIDTAEGLPHEVVILENQVTILDIEIDTGIR